MVYPTLVNVAVSKGVQTGLKRMDFVTGVSYISYIICKEKCA